MSKTLHDATLPVQLEGLLFGDDIMMRTSVVGRCPSHSGRLRASSLAGLLILASLLLCSLVSYASVPAVVASMQNDLPWAAGGTITKVVTDPAGNIFVASDNGSITKLPANGGAPQTIAAGIGPLWGLALGSDGSVYYTDRWNNHVRKIPYLGGGAYGSEVNMFSNIPNLGNWWFGGSDLVVDAQNNIYISYEWGGGIDKVSCTSPGSCTGVHVLGGSPSGEITNLALDSADNLYVTTNDGKVFRVAAGTTSAVQIGTGVTAAGASVDAAGNVIIADKGNNRIVIIPNVGGTLDTANQFTLAANVSSVANAAPDPSGNIIVPSGSLTKLSFASADLGEIALNSTSATATVNYVFNAAATPTINVVIKGHATSEFAAVSGTCASGVARAAGDSCSLDVNFTPSVVGERIGAVVFSDPAGIALSTFPVSGIGDGAGILVDPGTQSSIADVSNFSAPQAVALDGAGNLYVADTGNSQVLMLPAGGGEPESIGSGLNKPAGVAVDAAGNVFISNTVTVDKTDVGQVVVVPNEGGTLKTSDQFVIVTGLAANPSGVAVDRFGNVFVADTGNKRVLKLTKSLLGSYSLGSVVGTGYNNPVSVTADASGNVFVGDGTEGVIYGISAESGAQYFVVTGLGFAGGMATDASGSIYVADSINKVVSRIPLQNGAFFPNGVTWIGSGFVTPQAVAIDAAGNAYVADTGAPGAFKVVRSQGLVDFGKFNLGIQSDTYISKLYNYGTQPLTVTDWSASGDTGDFNTTQDVCSTAIDPGKNCSLSTYFEPTASGNRTVTLTIPSNAGSIQQMYKGEGVALADSTITIAMTTPASGNPGFGSPVTFSATVAASSGGSVPTGNVVFAIDGTPQAPVTLASGTATFTTASMTGGPHNVTATYAGDSSFASSVSAPPLQVIVDPAAAAVAVYATSTTYGVTNTYNITDSATVTATVTAPIKTIPTGTVEFYAGNTFLGKGTVSSGVASASIAVGTLELGTYQLKAVYNADNGDTNFKMATSPTVSMVVTPPPTFTLSSNVDSATVRPGETGVYHITLTPLYNFQDSVVLNPQDTMNLNCEGLLPQTACVFTLTGNGTSSQSIGSATATFARGAFPSIILQLTTVGPANGAPTAAAMTKSQSGFFFAMLMPGLLGIFSLAAGRKRHAWKTVGIALVLVAVAFLMAGCSASHSNLPAKIAPSTGTPAGTTTVTVTATSTSSGSVSPSVTQTMQFQFTVVN